MNKSWKELKDFCEKHGLASCDEIITREEAITVCKERCETLCDVNNFILNVNDFWSDYYRLGDDNCLYPLTERDLQYFNDTVNFDAEEDGITDDGIKIPN